MTTPISPPNSSAKKRIQTAEYAEYAEKWNTFAYFAYSAVLSPFYFDDVFESLGFCAVLSGAAAVRRGFRLQFILYGNRAFVHFPFVAFWIESRPRKSHKSLAGFSFPARMYNQKHV